MLNKLREMGKYLLLEIERMMDTQMLTGKRVTI